VFQRPKIYRHHLLAAHNLTDRYEKGMLREYLQAKHYQDDDGIEALVR
jgi:hypothetical protein